MSKAVFCLVENQSQANHIVDQLIAARFMNEDISILYPNQTSNNDSEDYETSTRRPVKGNLRTEEHSKAPEGGVTGATIGGLLGGSLGLLAGIGALAIPGLGPFIAAGPIMAALSGSALGGSMGLLLGTLIGYGIPEYEAKKYENALKQGNILISVHTDNDEEIRRATDIMRREGGKDISSSSEKVETGY